MVKMSSNIYIDLDISATDETEYNWSPIALIN